MPGPLILKVLSHFSPSPRPTPEACSFDRCLLRLGSFYTITSTSIQTLSWQKFEDKSNYIYFDFIQSWVDIHLFSQTEFSERQTLPGGKWKRCIHELSNSPQNGLAQWCGWQQMNNQSFIMFAMNRFENSDLSLPKRMLCLFHLSGKVFGLELVSSSGTNRSNSGQSPAWLTRW